MSNDKLLWSYQQKVEWLMQQVKDGITPATPGFTVLEIEDLDNITMEQYNQIADNYLNTLIVNRGYLFYPAQLIEQEGQTTYYTFSCADVMGSQIVNLAIGLRDDQPSAMTMEYNLQEPTFLDIYINGTTSLEAQSVQYVAIDEYDPSTMNIEFYIPSDATKSVIDKFANAYFKIEYDVNRFKFTVQGETPDTTLTINYTITLKNILNQ